jgi:hypothetical protein
MPRRRYAPPLQKKSEKAKPSGYASLDPTGHVPASQISGGGGGGGGAPTTAEYIVKSSDATLSAERVLTDTASVHWDYATGGQAKANVQFGSTSTTATVGNDARLSDARTPTSHVLATNVALGGQHTISGATAGQVLRASSATAANFQALVEGDITNLVSDLGAKEATANKGAASGYASLDGTTKVPIAQLPTGTTGSAVAIGNDARLSDARTPTAHASTHASAGSDPVTPAAIGAVPTARAVATVAPLTGGGALSADLTLGVSAASTSAAGVAQLATSAQTTAGLVVQASDTRLSDARTPTAHATSHKSGGSDAIKLDELSAPTDVTTLNASTTAHGLLPKLPGGTSTFLRGDGAYAAPTAALALTTTEVSLGSTARRSGKVQITGLAGLTAGKPVLIQQAVGPYTGKGTRADEAEMDALTLSAAVLNATTIDIYWTSRFQVRGNYKVNFLVSA